MSIDLSKVLVLSSEEDQSHVISDGKPAIVIQASDNQIYTATFGPENPSVVFSQKTFKNNTASLAPTVADDLTLGYSTFSLWNNIGPTDTGIYICTDASPGAALWVLANEAAITISDEYPIVLGNLSDVMASGMTKGYFRLPYACNFVSVRASLLTASSSGAPAFDINKNGVSVLSSPLTIDANETTSLTATVQPSFGITSGNADDIITIDIDFAGTGAVGPIVYLTIEAV